MGRGQGDLADQALQVEDALERLAELAAGDGRAEALGHGVLAGGDLAPRRGGAGGARSGGAGRPGRSR